MTRVLVLGGAGMLGHKVSQVLSEHLETYATFHNDVPPIAGVFERVTPIVRVDAVLESDLRRAIHNVRPDFVVNAIGVVKQLPSADAIANIALNALLPHRLAQICAEVSSRLVHVSTDCVYSGLRGNYVEEDPPDALDLYGRSKALGEPSGEHVLTIRTSLIGRELGRRLGLVEWFLGQGSSPVKGYTRAVFSGVTTLAFADVLGYLILHRPRMNGLWHLSSTPVSKFQVLCWLQQAFGRTLTVIPDDLVTYDRSLNSDKFWAASGLQRPRWPEMIAGLTDDPTKYGGSEG